MLIKDATIKITREIARQEWQRDHYMETGETKNATLAEGRIAGLKIALDVLDKKF